MNEHTKNIIWGIVLIGIGAGYLGEFFRLWDFTLFFPGWWSLFLILPSIVHMIKYGIHFMALLGLCLGAYFLANANGWIDFHLTWPLLAAVCCICVGIHLLFTRRVKWYEYEHKD